MGIVVVRGALRFGLVHPDPLYQFVLLLQFALPPALNIGIIIIRLFLPSLAILLKIVDECLAIYLLESDS